MSGERRWRAIARGVVAACSWARCRSRPPARPSFVVDGSWYAEPGCGLPFLGNVNAPIVGGADGWRPVETNDVAPEEAASLRIYVGASSSDVSGPDSVYWDDVSLVPEPGSGLAAAVALASLAARLRGRPRRRDPVSNRSTR